MTWESKNEGEGTINSRTILSKKFIFSGEHEEDEPSDFTTQTSSTSKVKHTEHLPDDVFENYDDYYYYDDHSSESRVKRDLPSYNCKPTYGVPKEIKACR